MSFKAGPRNDTQWTRNAGRLSDETLLSQWDAASEASTLTGLHGSKEAGRRAANLFDEINRRGLDTSGVDVRDFSSGRIEASDTADAFGALKGLNRSKYGVKYSPTGELIAGNPRDVRRRQGLNKENDAKLAQLMQERDAADNENWINQNIDPTFDRAQQTLDSQMGTDAISAQMESAMRTRIGESVRLNEEGSLRRASSILGLRGLDPSSPAGAALAARAAERADAQLNDAFRELGLSVLTTNRQSRTQDAMAATQIATSRLAAHSSISNDRAGLVRMQTDVAGLIDALQQRREAQNQADIEAEIMRRAMEGDDGGAGGTIGTVLGGAAGFFIGGPMGAGLGASLGGSIGSSIGGGSNPGAAGSSPEMLKYLSSLKGSSYGSGYTPGNGYNGTVRQVSLPQYDANGYARY